MDPLNIGASRLGRFLKHGRYLQTLNMRSDDDIIESLKDLSDDSEERYEGITVGQIAKYWVDRYKILKQNPKNLITTSLILSSLAMISGIVSLLIGWRVHDMSLELTLGIMIFESLLAALALAWTVFVVIKMLGEPKAEQK